MKIGFFEMDVDEKKFFKDNLKGGIKGVYFKENINEVSVDKIKDLEAIVIFIDSEIDKKLLNVMSNLRYIATMSTGFDHIDIEACKEMKIKVSNVPHYGENTVAEHAFALILALVRNVHQAVVRTRKRDFSIEGLEGRDLKGKILGVIGAGHIGSHVIQYGKGFGMKVIAYSPKKNMNLSKRLGFDYVSFNELLKSSDVISIHAPLNDSTYHLINMKSVKKMKKGCYLVNTARGEILDNTALLYGLDKGIIAGAGLDVLEGEDDLKDHRQIIRNNKDGKILKENRELLRTRNVIITPHISFYTRGALMRIFNTTLENVNGFLIGKTRNMVY